MASSKTTVLGIRLDQERRGWIEAEAARQGLSIRAYFERMIDAARSEDQEAELADVIAPESVHGVAPDATTSTTTTVLGLRLDHERRGWVEAEAAHQGMSVRAYFERMIDEARFAGEEPAELAEALAWESFLNAPEVHDDISAYTETEARTADEAVLVPEPPLRTSTASPTEAPGLCDDVVSLVTISGRVIREVMGLPFALVGLATRPFRHNRAR